jgi:hypothetical protein
VGEGGREGKKGGREREINVQFYKFLYKALEDWSS